MKNTRTIPKIDGSGSATLIVTDGKVDPKGQPRSPNGGSGQPEQLTRRIIEAGKAELLWGVLPTPQVRSTQERSVSTFCTCCKVVCISKYPTASKGNVV